MKRGEREQFDRLFEEVHAALPPALLARLEEVPIILEDRPSPELLISVGLDPHEDDLCGLHSGLPLTERSVEHGALGDVVTLFREGIVDEAGGWEEWTDADCTALGGIERVRREIRVTLLHEIGHHFGLGEDDLERLGYG